MIERYNCLLDLDCSKSASWQGPAACVGIYIDSGSIYETEESIGVTHLLERLAFKSTKHRSHLQIVHEVESTGGNVGASASREQMGYSYDTLKAYLPAAVELLIDCVRNPVFLESEVQEQVSHIFMFYMLLRSSFFMLVLLQNNIAIII